VLSEKRVPRAAEPLKKRTETSVAGVAQGDQDVAHKAAPLGATNSAAGEYTFEIFFGEGGEPVEARMEE